MYLVQRYLLDVLFEGNLEMYKDYIDVSTKEYVDIINQLSSTEEVATIRSLVHKLIGLIGYFQDTNYELIYYCRLLLNLEKNQNQQSYYLSYIKFIVDYDKRNLFGLI
jgi:hypothetical protein